MKKALLSCVALVALALFPREVPAESVGVLTAVKAPVTIARGGETLSARVGDGIELRDVIRTGAGAKAKALFNDEVILVVTEETAVEVTKHLFDTGKTWRDSIFDLRKGMIRSTLEKYTRDSAYIVTCPNAIAGVKGTDFLVRHTPGKEPLTEVFVFQGSVEVKNSIPDVPGARVLAADSKTAVRGGAPPSPPAPLSAQDREELDRASSMGDQVTAKAGAGLKAPGEAPAGGPSARSIAAGSVGGAGSSVETGNPQVSVAGMDFIPPKGVNVTIPGSAGPSSGPPGAKVIPERKPAAPPVKPAGPPPAGPPVRPPISR